MTVHASGRGNPSVHLQDGYELSASFNTDERINQTIRERLVSPRAIATADFDEDGAPDLVCGYKGGHVSLYRANTDTAVRAKADAAQTQSEEVQVPQPFLANADTIDAPESSSVISGDFNADGHQDVLAYSLGGDTLSLLAGTGHGTFLAPHTIKVAGRITAATAGEIGRSDGLADLAVAVIDRRGVSSLLVFEHPEGAFRHQPEIFTLPQAVTDIALGSFDEDAYGDIALAAGPRIIVIHGRGQAYPWDLDQRLDIKRPAPVVESRVMPFEIAAIAAGHFTENPGESLVALGEDGTLHLLEPQRKPGVLSKKTLPARSYARPSSFAPTGADARRFLFVGGDGLALEDAAGRQSGPLTASRLSIKDRHELLKKRFEEEAAKFSRLSREERSRLRAQAHARGDETKQRSKAAFLRTLAAQPTALAGWQLQNLISDARISSAAHSSFSGPKLIKVRVSSDGLDDVAVVDAAARQIQVVTRRIAEGQTPGTEILSLDVEGDPTAILPMQLNADALTDLVVMRDGSSAPSVVVTEATITITVNTTSDGASNCLSAGQPCTLRQAIQLANANPGADQINFNIFGCGPHKIQPLSELPPITEAVTIFGGSQPCSSPTSPRIEINGSLLTGSGIGADGLKVRASNCFITGLAITGFPSVTDPDTFSKIGGNGITLETPVGSPRNRFNFVANNFLGVAPDGVTDSGNGATGILIFDSDSNSIQNNTISGNDGSGLAVTNGNSNVIVANKIGTNVAGTAKLPNDSSGLFLTGANNQVGGDGANQGNTISGNGKMRADGDPSFTACTGTGVQIFALVSEDTGVQLTLNNFLKGNRIGTDSSGTQALGNCVTGVVVAPVTATTIGSITEAGRNVISDNGYDGIHCDTRFDDTPGGDGGFCSISGNNIGTDVTGTAAMGNDRRSVRGGVEFADGTVFVFNNNSMSNIGAPGGTSAGGDCTGFCNLISGNNQDQFSLSAIGRHGKGTVAIYNNFIGTNKSGTAALANGTDAVYADNNDGFPYNADNDTFIGRYITEGNVNESNLISGNVGSAIALFPGTTLYNSAYNVEANLIGTDTQGASALPNGDGSSGAGAIVAFALFPTTTIDIGAVNPFSRNVISGNNANGIVAVGGLTENGQINIINNYLGLSKFNQPLGNAKHGISLQGMGTVVGGSGAGEGNVIAYNTLAGVAVLSATGATNNINNTIRGNTIRDNGGLGIDLTVSDTFNAPDDGVTPNDECPPDEDDGANHRQNYPDLFIPIFNDDGTVTVVGILHSQPSKTYKIDFYSNVAADPSDYGEGEAYIGTQNVSTNGNGFVLFDFTSSVQVSSLRKITATATDPDGNTSEFSCYAGGCGHTTSASTKAALIAAVREAEPQPQITCSLDIVVNINTDEPDADDDPDHDGMETPQLDPNKRDRRCDVFTDDAHPGDQCSLRAAIREANARPGFDVIKFAIPGDGVHTIAPATPLPDITGRVRIDGMTQGGESYDGPPLVEVKSTLQFISGSGGTTSGTGSSLIGLVVNKGIIRFSESAGFEVKKCYVGVNSDGLSASEQQLGVGVDVTSSSNGLIGGPVGGDGNVISNFSRGIQSNSPIRIENNKIGTNKNGTDIIGNGIGIRAHGSGIEIVNNLISSNRIEGGADPDTFDAEIDCYCNGAKILGNLIGASVGEQTKLSNKLFGIVIHHTSGQDESTDDNAIERNTILGIDLTGGPTLATAIRLEGGSGNRINGNRIGITSDGARIFANVIGIDVSARSTDGASNNEIGVGEPNVIVGCRREAIIVGGGEGENFAGTKIANNLIGVTPDNQIIGNGLGTIPVSGIHLIGGLTHTQISNNIVAGSRQHGIEVSPPANGTARATDTLIDGNIVVANVGIGISLVHSSDGWIHHNHVGTGLGNQTGIGNKIGLSISGDSKNNRVENNEFADNLDFNILLGNSTPVFDGPSFDPANGSLGNNPRENKFVGNIIKNSKVGLAITEGADNNDIGDPAGDLPNIITGNLSGVGYGIFLGTTNVSPQDEWLPTGNKIFHNFVGVAGDAAAPNKVGLVITLARDNIIGGDTQSQRNIFAANLEQGILVSDTRTRGNTIAHNDIGLNGVLLDSVFGNGGDGVGVFGASRNSIKYNRIGNNGGNGINALAVLLAPGDNESLIISGNEIGVAGNTATGNRLAGIRFENVHSALVGLSGDPKNIIAANGGDGILIEGDNSTLNVISNSIIGTNEVSNSGIGNGGSGVYVIGGGSNTIGGVQSAGNLICGNNGNGIFLQGSTQNKLYGNRVGIFRHDDGTDTKLANGLNGVKILETSNTAVGDGVLNGYRNFIGGNVRSGVVIQGVTSQQNRIKGNYIGTNLAQANLGNGLHGVHVTEQGSENVVGGNEIQAANTIAFNGGAGVYVDDMALCCNNLDPNSIYGNNGLGIDLGSLGGTPNDPGDADSGPNNLQNFPEFISATLVPGGSLVIQYKVDSSPANSNYGSAGLHIEVFKADSTLEGETFIGSSNYTEANYLAGMPGPATLIVNNASALGIQGGDKLVATATDGDGNTSEFTSTNVGTVAAAPTAATAIIGGQVLTPGGMPLPGVTITLSGTQLRKTITNEHGQYQFREVETTGFYNVAPALVNYSFSPANKSFSALGNTTQANFTAIPNSDSNYNPLDSTEYFVRQQYVDFLNREPDEAGFNFWVNNIEGCGTNNRCREIKRIDTSAAFFLSIEFQETGYLVERIYKTAYGDAFATSTLTGTHHLLVPRVRFHEFLSDALRISRNVIVLQPGWEQRLENNKQEFAADFVRRSSFTDALPTSMKPAAFVDKLNQNAGNVLSQSRRDAVIELFGGTSDTSDLRARARALRQVAEDDELTKKESNNAFVLMQYFGYLRRNPNDAQDTDYTGYDFWLTKLKQFNGNYVNADMVKAFLLSSEYRQRFAF